MSLQSAPVAEMLPPVKLTEIGISPGPHYETVASLVDEALGLGVEPLDDALQTFEILRGCMAALQEGQHQTLVYEFARHDDDFEKAPTVGAQQQAWRDRDRVLGSVADACATSVFRAHLHASDRSWDDDGVGRRWRVPLAERLADEVKRLDDRHPLVSGLGVSPDALWLAIKGVSTAAGRTANELQFRATPEGRVGVLPDDLWLDTGRPLQT